MLNRTSVLGIVIALMIIAGLPFMAGCRQKKESSEELSGSETAIQVVEEDTEDDEPEGLSVDDEFLITLDENQGVDGF